MAATLLAACTALVAIAATTSREGDGTRRSTEPTATTATPETAGTTAPPVAPVVRQDLTARDEVTGWLAYQDPVPLVAGRDGVVTWMPAVGTVVGRGDVVAEIDGAATRLLIGERPAWRRMAVGEPDGLDIKQLNDNLAALGYADRQALPDQRFDWRTRDAVYRWQADLGLPRTGVVDAGGVVFMPAAVRIGAVDVQPGRWVGAGEPLASVTGPEQVVTVEVGVRERQDMAEGQLVTVLFPDGSRAQAGVRSIGRVVTGGGGSDEEEADQDAAGGEATVTAVIDAPELAEPLDLDAAPVVVVIERVLAEDVLTVPVGALVARPGGRYAVERVRAGGAAELVAVEPGQFAAGLVEVSGELAERDRVVVPS